MSLFVQSITARKIIGQCLLAVVAVCGVVQHSAAQNPSEAEKLKAVRPATSSEKLQITQAVQRSLIDPDSARFGDVLVLPNKHACVAVNSKNRFGGYTGFQMAFVSFLEGSWHFMATKDVDFPKCASIIVSL
ncbi:hypothetical protein [Hydrogenophaga sp. BPS33]|uniref:hypothetical protein n=1 Tax=Hydrogenophaga sp. BPS33 TaxID=2651974 RepID=UPI0013205037|nr:hypothetical protein [Hydrogenophaga sp. BPS33]QHE86413.1 hypothetical protein F9K07_16640 [Hydrogenophaga sp. BPS33]